MVSVPGINRYPAQPFDAEMTRIAIIAGTYQPNLCGVAHYTHHLRSALLDRGVESVVLTTFAAAEHLQQQDVLGCVKNWHPVNLLPLVKAIHQTDADMLHIQHAAGTYGFERSPFLLPLLLKLTDWHKPVVTTIHEYGWWEWQPRWLPAPLLESLKTWGQDRGLWDREDGFLLTGSDAIITSNRNAADAIYDRLPYLEPKVYQIPIGANIHVWDCDRPQARQQLRQVCGWSEDVQVFVFFGFLHPVKGVETLLTAFKRVLAVQPQARLLLVGGVESLALPGQAAANYWDKLQNAIACLELNNTVHVTGYVDERTASHSLAGADIGVLPFNHGVTLKSGSLLALMAHALPVIATRSTPPDVELNESLLRQVTPRNGVELEAEMLRLLEDAELRKRLGEAGQQFSQQFSWQAIAAAHVEIYQSVLKSPGLKTPSSAPASNPLESIICIEDN